MPQDRVVRWQKTRPNNRQIKEVFEDYVGEAGNVSIMEDRLNCVLLGKESFALRRVAPERVRPVEMDDNEQRLIEVWVDKNSVFVMTRMADEFTSAVAEGFADLCANTWGGKRE